MAPRHSDTTVLEFIENTRHCRDIAALTRLAQTTFDSLGFDRWAYQLQRPNPIAEIPPLILHNFPDRWVSHYIAQGYSRIDPVITEGARQTKPFQWSLLTVGQEVLKPVSDYQSLASEFGLVDGIGIPIGGPSTTAMVSMASEQKPHTIRAELTHHKVRLFGVSLAFHTAAQDLVILERSARNRAVLTPRQRDCLLWAFHGKTAWEIGRILNIAERSVVFHLENARRKLGASSRQHAVIKALLDGYITP